MSSSIPDQLSLGALSLADLTADDVDVAIATRECSHQKIMDELLKLRIYRNSITPPISRVPDDILAEIFRIFAHDLWTSHSRRDPLYISHVCSHWRTLAHSLPFLWNVIHTGHYPGYTARLIDLSKGLPLSVVSDKNYYQQDDVNTNFFHLLSDVADQIQHLKLYVRRSLMLAFQESPFWQGEPDFEPDSALVLETIDLVYTTQSFEGYTEPPDHFWFLHSSTSLPRLSTLRLEHFPPSITPPLLRPTLTELEVNPSQPQSIRDWLRLLKALPLLKNLSISDICLGSILPTTPVPTSRAIDMERLCKISLRVGEYGSGVACTQLLNHLRIPSEAKIDIFPPTTSQTQNSSSMSWLRRRTVGVFDGSKLSLAHIEQLCIYNVAPQPQALPRFVHLRELHCHHARHRTWLQALISLASDDLLSLRALTLKFPKWHVHSGECTQQPFGGEPLSVLIDAFLALRRSYGRPMEELNLHDIRFFDPVHDGPWMQRASTELTTLTWSHFTGKDHRAWGAPLGASQHHKDAKKRAQLECAKYLREQIISHNSSRRYDRVCGNRIASAQERDDAGREHAMLIEVCQDQGRDAVAGGHVFWGRTDDHKVPPWTPDDIHPPAQFVVSPESRDDFSYDGYTVRVLLYGDTWFDHRCEIGYFEMTVEALPEYVDEVDAPAVGIAMGEYVTLEYMYFFNGSINVEVKPLEDSGRGVETVHITDAPRINGTYHLPQSSDWGKGMHPHHIWPIFSVIPRCITCITDTWCITNNFGQHPFTFDIETYCTRIHFQLHKLRMDALILPAELIQDIVLCAAEPPDGIYVEVQGLAAVDAPVMMEHQDIVCRLSLVCRHWCWLVRPSLLRHFDLWTLQKLDRLTQLICPPFYVPLYPLLGQYIKSIDISGDAAQSIWLLLTSALPRQLQGLTTLLWERSHASTNYDGWDNIPAPPRMRALLPTCFQQLATVTTLVLKYHHFPTFRRLAQLVVGLPRLLRLQLAYIEWAKDVLAYPPRWPSRPSSLRIVELGWWRDDQAPPVEAERHYARMLWLLVGPTRRSDGTGGALRELRLEPADEAVLEDILQVKILTSEVRMEIENSMNNVDRWDLVVNTDRYRCILEMIYLPSGLSYVHKVHINKYHSPTQERRVLSPKEFATLLCALDTLAKLSTANDITITFAISSEEKDTLEVLWKRCMPDMYAKGHLDILVRPSGVSRGKQKDDKSPDVYFDPEIDVEGSGDVGEAYTVAATDIHPD
ncbi:hypothetical protein PHLGIDRAFT_17227 [Phlebiopsis gigantea 11061_1 CR5-6]|uniref:Uncharacterized protein n=1 Tax=Phlebiopsis gigantea (strain 11061_1 CR5-6) TaxID=745531 RepID=A0A0C3P9M5_PHLG1|nr:hypothetical protein PHLGIDRAFT_17227 [Phlebiopsis gigantea 11061_1 CR5-6]